MLSPDMQTPPMASDGAPANLNHSPPLGGSGDVAANPGLSVPVTRLKLPVHSGPSTTGAGRRNGGEGGGLQSPMQTPRPLLSEYVKALAESRTELKRMRDKISAIEHRTDPPPPSPPSHPQPPSHQHHRYDEDDALDEQEQDLARRDAEARGAEEEYDGGKLGWEAARGDSSGARGAESRGAGSRRIR